MIVIKVLSDLLAIVIFNNNLQNFAIELLNLRNLSRNTHIYLYLADIGEMITLSYDYLSLQSILTTTTTTT